MSKHTQAELFIGIMLGKKGGMPSVFVCLITVCDSITLGVV